MKTKVEDGEVKGANEVVKNNLEPSSPWFNAYNFANPSIKAVIASGLLFLAVSTLVPVISGFASFWIISAIQISFILINALLSDIIIKGIYTANHNVEKVKEGDILDDVVKELIKDNPKLANLKNITVYTYDSKGKNAFAVGMIPNRKAIYVSTGLLNALEGDKNALKAVVAHELGHILGGHSFIKATLRSLSAFASTASKYAEVKMIFGSDNKQQNEGDKKKDENKNKLLQLLSIIFVKLFNFFGVAYISRQLEFDADNTARTCVDSEGQKLGMPLIRALTKLSSEKFEDLPKEPTISEGFLSFLSSLVSTHPTLKERVYNIYKNDKLDQFNQDNKRGFTDTFNKTLKCTFKGSHSDISVHFRKISSLSNEEMNRKITLS